MTPARSQRHDKSAPVPEVAQEFLLQEAIQRESAECERFKNKNKSPDVNECGNKGTGKYQADGNGKQSKMKKERNKVAFLP